MSEQYINIYQSARNAAGLTQERAAERIGKSVESVRAYESDGRAPDDSTVLRMVEVYNAPYLAYQHLRAKSEVARSVIPEIEPKDLPAAILRLLKEVGDILKCRDELIDIGSDGVITPDEKERWDAIIKEFMDVEKAFIAVKYAK